MSDAPDLPSRSGWDRRFVVDLERAPEVAALYRSLGYETFLEPVGPREANPACGECPLVRLGRLVTIFTRPA